MSSTNTQGTTPITVQFDAEPQYRRRRAGRPGGHRQGRRAAAAQHAAPAFVSEGESGRAADSVSGADFRHAAALHGGRIRRDAAGAAHLHGQRRLAGAGVRRAEIRGARAGGSGRTGRARHRHRRSACRPSQRSNVNLPTGKLYGDKQAFTVQSSGAVDERRGLPADDRGLSQWHAGAAGAARQRDRRRRERQGRGLVQRRARHDPGASSASPAPTPWRWWTTSRRCCRVSARRSRRR